MVAIQRNEARRALERMLANGPLTDLPRSRPDQELLYALAAVRFEPGRTYDEKAVNEVLREWLEGTSVPYGVDHVTFRRCLVDWRFLVRDKAGAGYRVSPERIEDAIDDGARELEPRAIIAEVQVRRAERKRERAN